MSMIVMGSSLNFLMLSVPPRGEISFLYVAIALCPPGRMPCMIGNATEMCFPDMWANLDITSFSSSSLSKKMLVGILSYFL